MADGTFGLARELSFDEVLRRIRDCGTVARVNELNRALLHAYVCLLDPAELHEAAVQMLDQPEPVRRALRNRLCRLAREQRVGAGLDELGRRLLCLRSPDASNRIRIDALLSHLYGHLGPPTRQAVLERWLDRGTSGAAARWLKAIADDDLLFSLAPLLQVWRRWRSSRAAALLAKRAPAEVLNKILPEMVEHRVEGWIVSRATLRASAVSEETWIAIRALFPATYAYLCEKTGRQLCEDDAFAIVAECDPLNADRGLALWSIGQLGLSRVLERVYGCQDTLREQDLRRIGFVH